MTPADRGATRLVVVLGALATGVGMPTTASAQAAIPPSATPQIWITDVTVVDVRDGSLLPDRLVRIEGPRIVEIRAASDGVPPTGAPPTEVAVVDGRGGYLIPGLWDMHVHVFNNNDAQPPNTWGFPLMLANGVTGVRDMWVKPGEASDQLAAWRRGLEDGTFVGPRFGAVGTLVDGDPPIQPGARIVTTAAEARAFVDEIRAAGIDFVKPYSHLSAEAYDALAHAADEAGLYLAGHGPDALTSRQVAESGQRSLEHLTGVHVSCSSIEDELRASEDELNYFMMGRVFVDTFDPDKCAELYRAFREHDTWQVPTLITNRIWELTADIESLRADEGLPYTPKWESAEWDWVEGLLAYSSPEERQGYAALYALERRIVGEMYEAGVPFLAGTDVGNPYIYPGFSLIDEIAEFVAAGLPPLAALQTATLNPARYLGRDDDLGTVTEGKLADLVLLDANPLDDVGNLSRVRAVFVNGRLFDHDTLQRMRIEVVEDHFLETLSLPVPLPAIATDPEALAALVGDYEFVEGDPLGEVTLVDGTLRVTFDDWVDELEWLGGSMFRVPGTSVYYVFLTDAEGEVWGFELNDGTEVLLYRLISGAP